MVIRIFMKFMPTWYGTCIFGKTLFEFEFNGSGNDFVPNKLFNKQSSSSTKVYITRQCAIFRKYKYIIGNHGGLCKIGYLPETHLKIRSSDNDSTGFWPPGSLHTLGADGHI